MYFQRNFRKLRVESLSLYRSALRVIRQLDSGYQQMYYDYTRLKYSQYHNLRDEKKIIQLLNDAHEDLEWLRSVITRKQQR